MTNTATGVLSLSKKGHGTLHELTKPFDLQYGDIHVPTQLVRKFRLPEGVTITGPTRSGKQGQALSDVRSISGMSPGDFQRRTPFRRLVAINPNERFNLGMTGEISTRLVDLMAPIGKGTRGLIVAPPKAGKTMMLEHIAQAIHASEPETRLIILLVDERPEEVTHFRRSVEAEVFASSSDQTVEEHVALAEFMLAHIRTELECGHDVVVLVDSLTRMSRTFNLQGSMSSRRTLSGGMEAGALEIPRRFFGLARNIENGGSVTIIATVLIDTGSRMDDVIFEEFKGTGNSEIVLDRSLAEAYIYPAIDLAASGTRKEELLFDDVEGRKVAQLRRRLSEKGPKDAMLLMLDMMNEYPTNEALLDSISMPRR